MDELKAACWACVCFSTGPEGKGRRRREREKK